MHEDSRTDMNLLDPAKEPSSSPRELISATIDPVLSKLLRGRPRLRTVSRGTMLGEDISLDLERTVAPFLIKLFGILSDESITCIQWSEDGKRLVMVNQTAFQV